MKGWRFPLEGLFGAFWYLAVVVVVPVAALMIFGVMYLWEQQVLLTILGGWLVVTLMAYTVFFLRRLWIARRDQGDEAMGTAADLPERLAPQADWSDNDHEVWNNTCQSIEAMLDEAPTWQALQPLSLQLLADVARHYKHTADQATWRFTLPEGLLIIEETARRYRAIVDAHLPYADRITVASILSLYRRQDQIVTSLTWMNRARRLIRLVNPVGAVLGEVRDHVTDKVLAKVGHSLQTGLKSLLLQEVAQAGIHLYSGRLKVSDAELSAYESEALSLAQDRKADPREPLQLLVLGQVSAGKSSLINAVIDSLSAEVDRLPTTDRVTVYPVTLGDTSVHLIDTPGVVGDEETVADLLAAILQADLLIWVARATQPARAADQALWAATRAAYEADPAKRRPPVLLVVSHIDLVSAQDAAATSIRPIATSVREQIGLPDDVPTIAACLVPPRADALESVMNALLDLFDAAAQTQLNRRRVERARQTVPLSNRWRQARKLGAALGRTVIRRR
jgi:GTPase SAR1 family protein